LLPSGGADEALARYDRLDVYDRADFCPARAGAARIRGVDLEVGTCRAEGRRYNRRTEDLPL
jgi:hypothetical protein